MLRRAASAVLLACLVPAGAAAQEGWGIVATIHGRIFFTDLPRALVWRLDPDGTRSVALQGVRSHALVSIADGSVYGTNAFSTGPPRTWRLDAEGRVHPIVTAGHARKLGLRAFLVDTDGTLYSEARRQPSRLVRLPPKGGLETVADGFGRIDGLAWSPEGSILVTDGPYLRMVGLDGRVTTLGGGPLTETRSDANLLGVTPNGSGGAFVSDFGRGRVLNVGRLSGVAQEYASGFVWAPTGVARDGEGLVVLEYLQSPWSALGRAQIGPYLRVRRLSMKGGVRTLAVIWGTRTLPAAATVLAGGVALVAWRILRLRRPATVDAARPWQQ